MEQRVVDLADGVVAVVQGHGESGVSNAGIVHSEGRALVVDTFMFPDMAEILDHELRRRAAAAAVVLNTHHHVDHIGGNTLFPTARIVAHPHTVGGMDTTMGLAAVYDSFMPAFAGRFADLEIVPPEPSLEGLDGLPLGAELRSYVPAHTQADTVAWLPQQKILFTGDLCFFEVTPLAIQGLVSTWMAALDDLIALEPDVVVPGHGPVGGPGDIRTVRDYLGALLDTGRRAVEAGVDLDDALRSFDPGPFGEAIESERTLVNLDRAMQEARGEITASQLAPPPASFSRLLQPPG